jgi:KRAB domain-containing zinc finger protein
MLNHSGVKGFICEVCGVAFALENTLKVHLRRHTGERPYYCKTCDKTFSQLSALRYHEKACKLVNDKEITK